MEQLVIQYAPLIVIVVYFLTNNRLMVKPEELEKKHREIIEDMEKKFVTWTAFKTVQDSLEDKFTCIADKVDKIFDLLIDKEDK